MKQSTIIIMMLLFNWPSFNSSMEEDPSFSDKTSDIPPDTHIIIHKFVDRRKITYVKQSRETRENLELAVRIDPSRIPSRWEKVKKKWGRKTEKPSYEYQYIGRIKHRALDDIGARNLWYTLRDEYNQSLRKHPQHL